MKFLYQTYLDTINPENDYSILNSERVCISIAIHLIIYMVAYKLLSVIFEFSDRSSFVFVLLILIMSSGYYYRLTRSKSLYEYYLDKGFNKKISKRLAMKQINNAYFTWYFLG